MVCRLALTLAMSVLPFCVLATRAGAFETTKELFERTPLYQVLDEADPTNMQSCEAMGQISVIYETGNAGPPSVGLRITDPRGRKIGYDPRIPKVWQELSLAEGFVACDETDDATLFNHCAAHIQICGPISGAYKLEVLPTRNSAYSISVVGVSQPTDDEIGFHSTDSRADYRGKIQQLEPDILMLNYSRKSGARIKLGRRDPDVATGEHVQRPLPNLR